MFIYFLNYLDFPVFNQITFQDAATSTMQGIVNLHHHIFCIIIIILIFVSRIFLITYQFSKWDNKLFTNINSIIFYFANLDKNVSIDFDLEQAYLGKPPFQRDLVFVKTASSFFLKTRLNKLKYFINGFYLNISHGTFLEIIWTWIPSFILLLIVGPSFSLLYAMDGFINPEITIKVLAHQWYWSYEYSDFYFNYFSKFIPIKSLEIFPYEIKSYQFDSYMVATSDLNYGDLRLLEVDNCLYVPTSCVIRFDITSDDVIHAFSVPSLGIKVDAIPGRLNIAYAEVLRAGLYFGQCSELCGVNHGFMPIKIIALNLLDYIQIMYIINII